MSSGCHSYQHRISIQNSSGMDPPFCPGRWHLGTYLLGFGFQDVARQDCKSNAVNLYSVLSESLRIFPIRLLNWIDAKDAIVLEVIHGDMGDAADEIWKSSRGWVTASAPLKIGQRPNTCWCRTFRFSSCPHALIDLYIITQLSKVCFLGSLLGRPCFLCF